MKKALPAALLLTGFLLLYFGFDEYQTLQSEVSLFGGAGSSKVIWLMVGGAAATIAGAAGLLRDKISD